MCLYTCPSLCVYPRDLCFLCGELLCSREPALFFFLFFLFSCLRVGLRSKASVCQYLVIVCASIFIFHSLWSLSPCVWPNYITWPCPVHITPTPCAPPMWRLKSSGMFLWMTRKDLVDGFVAYGSLLLFFVKSTSHFCIAFSARCVPCKRDAFHAHFRSLARTDVLWLLCLV